LRPVSYRWPKSATFRTVDVVGLDTLVHVVVCMKMHLKMSIEICSSFLNSSIRWCRTNEVWVVNLAKLKKWAIKMAAVRFRVEPWNYGIRPRAWLLLSTRMTMW
jgi:hypothetical protein